MESGNKKWIIWVIGIVLALIVVTAIWPFTIIDAGSRGVVYKVGAIDRVLEPGFYWITPLVERVVKWDIQVAKEQVEADAASKDLQTVKAVIAVNYSVNADKVGELAATIGENYKSKLINPAIQEAVKAATAQYTAEELITKRPLVKEDIRKDLVAQLNSPFITIGEVSIVNFDFSPSFNAAIEAKVTAEQNALASKNKLEQVKYEASQKIATAEAEARAIRLASDAANNEKYVSLKALEVQLEFAKHWNGQYPSTYIVGGGSGSNMPLIIPIPTGK